MKPFKLEMPKDFNLIATTERTLESRACSELWMLLRAVGDEHPLVDRIGIWGIIAAYTKLDPIESILRIETEIKEKPTKYNSLFRIMPIQKIVPTSIENIVEATKEFPQIIKPEETFRITFEKRRTDLSSKTVIDAVAEEFPQKVDLKNPNWVILIEVLGRNTGVSLINPNKILNIQKEHAKAFIESRKKLKENT